MIHVHVPESLFMIGMVLGVAIAPMVILGTLFLIVRAMLGV
jgi:hypothetical protein